MRPPRTITLALALVVCVWSTPVSAAPPDARLAWANHCASCHGMKGKAPARYAARGVPDLSDPDWQAMRPDKQIRALIADGSKGTEMEAFRQKLSAAEIDALVKLIRTFRPLR